MTDGNLYVTIGQSEFLVSFAGFDNGPARGIAVLIMCGDF
jgi:hypothetical protein